jgi:hypothetical protein
MRCVHELFRKGGARIATGICPGSITNGNFGLPRTVRIFPRGKRLSPPIFAAKSWHESGR